MTTDTVRPSSHDDAALTECTLDIEGMTCASCVNRVQRALARVDGVTEASVNLAMETAAVTYDPDAVEVSALTDAVRNAGYHGTLRDAAETVGDGGSPVVPDAVDELDARRD